MNTIYAQLLKDFDNNDYVSIYNYNDNSFHDVLKANRLNYSEYFKFIAKKEAGAITLDDYVFLKNHGCFKNSFVKGNYIYELIDFKMFKTSMRNMHCDRVAVDLYKDFNLTLSHEIFNCSDIDYIFKACELSNYFKQRKFVKADKFEKYVKRIENLLLIA